MTELQIENLQNKLNEIKYRLRFTKNLNLFAIIACVAVGIYDMYIAITISDSILESLFLGSALFLFFVAFFSYKTRQHLNSSLKKAKELENKLNEIGKVN